MHPIVIVLLVLTGVVAVLAIAQQRMTRSKEVTQ